MLPFVIAFKWSSTVEYSFDRYTHRTVIALWFVYWFFHWCHTRRQRIVVVLYSCSVDLVCLLAFWWSSKTGCSHLECCDKGVLKYHSNLRQLINHTHTHTLECFSQSFIFLFLLHFEVCGCLKSIFFWNQMYVEIYFWKIQFNYSHS